MGICPWISPSVKHPLRPYATKGPPRSQRDPGSRWLALPGRPRRRPSNSLLAVSREFWGVFFWFKIPLKMHWYKDVMVTKIPLVQHALVQNPFQPMLLFWMCWRNAENNTYNQQIAWFKVVSMLCCYPFLWKQIDQWHKWRPPTKHGELCWTFTGVMFNDDRTPMCYSFHSVTTCYNMLRLNCRCFCPQSFPWTEPSPNKLMWSSRTEDAPKLTCPHCG